MIFEKIKLKLVIVYKTKKKKLDKQINKSKNSIEN